MISSTDSSLKTVLQASPRLSVLNQPDTLAIGRSGLPLSPVSSAECSCCSSIRSAPTALLKQMNGSDDSKPPFSLRRSSTPDAYGLPFLAVLMDRPASSASTKETVCFDISTCFHFGVVAALLSDKTHALPRRGFPAVIRHARPRRGVALTGGCGVAGSSVAQGGNPK